MEMCEGVKVRGVRGSRAGDVGHCFRLREIGRWTWRLGGLTWFGRRMDA